MEEKKEHRMKCIKALQKDLDKECDSASKLLFITFITFLRTEEETLLVDYLIRLCCRRRRLSGSETRTTDETNKPVRTTLTKTMTTAFDFLLFHSQNKKRVGEK